MKQLAAWPNGLFPCFPAAFLAAALALPSGLPAGESVEQVKFEKALVEVNALLAREDFASACRILGRFEDPYSPILDRVLEERKRVMEAALKFFEKLKAKALGLSREKHREEAVNLVKGVADRLPPALRFEAEKLQEEIEGEMSAPQEPEVASARPRGPILRRLAALDFLAARKGIEELRREEPSAAELEVLAREVAMAEEAWEKIRSALEGAAQKGKTFDVPGSLRPIGEPSARSDQTPALWKASVRGVQGTLVQLSPPQKDPPSAYRILSLPDALLLALLLGDDRAGAGIEAMAREALGLLLFHSEGPARASALLFDPAIGPKSEDYKKRLREEAGAWLARKADVLDGRRLTLAEKPGEIQALSLLAEEYRDLILSAKASGIDPAVAKSLREGFLETRGATAPPGDLFPSAKVRTAAGGEVSISYDLSSPEGARDIHPVGKVSMTPRSVNGKLYLKGEYRLFEGDPFLGSLKVRGTAAELPKAAPNVNVALWTSPSDQVTFREGAKESLLDRLQKDEALVGDYFVFGMGYRTVVNTTMGKAAEEVSLAGAKAPVKFPAHVLLAGSRSKTVHRNFSECLWGLSLKPPFPSRFEFSVEWDAGKIRWAVNRKDLPLGKALALPGPKEARRGSATIFTNDQLIALESLEIAGKLDERWLRSRRMAMAGDELRKLAPELLEDREPAKGSAVGSP